jgi:hypothetical protein
MFEKYNELFQIYLRVCKSKYDSNKPYDNLKDCCITCNNLKWELSGMLDLLEYTKEITTEEREREFQRLIKTFSTHDLFNAYMEDGEVMVWSR